MRQAILGEASSLQKRHCDESRTETKSLNPECSEKRLCIQKQSRCFAEHTDQWRDRRRRRTKLGHNINSICDSLVYQYMSISMARDTFALFSKESHSLVVCSSSVCLSFRDPWVWRRTLMFSDWESWCFGKEREVIQQRWSKKEKTDQGEKNKNKDDQTWCFSLMIIRGQRKERNESEKQSSFHTRRVVDNMNRNKP